jgi:GAF domain-containing protein
MSGPGDDLAAIVAGAGAALAADRCWLYARDPARRRGIALVRWLRAVDVADVPRDLWAWADEAPDLPARDPLFARALAGVPLDAVDDVEAAGVDAALERALGHRAFLHVNLHRDGELWGTLQPGMTGAPRAWAAADEALVLAVRAELADRVAALVAGRGERLRSRLVVASG